MSFTADETNDDDFSYTYDEEIQNFTGSLASAVFEFRSLSPEPLSPWYTPMDSIRPATPPILVPPASPPQDMLDINELVRFPSEEPMVASDSPGPYGGTSSSMAVSHHARMSASESSLPVTSSQSPDITNDAGQGLAPHKPNKGKRRASPVPAVDVASGSGASASATIGPSPTKKRRTKAPPPPKLIAAANGILAPVHMVATVSNGPSIHRCRIGDCNATILQGTKHACQDHLTAAHFPTERARHAPADAAVYVATDVVACGWKTEDVGGAVVVCPVTMPLANLGQHVVAVHVADRVEWHCPVEGCGYVDARMDVMDKHIRRECHRDLVDLFPVSR